MSWDSIVRKFPKNNQYPTSYHYFITILTRLNAPYINGNLRLLWQNTIFKYGISTISMCHGFQLAMLNFQSHQAGDSYCQAVACPKDSSGTNVPRPKKMGRWGGFSIGVSPWKMVKSGNLSIKNDGMMEIWCILQRQKNRFWEQALKLEFNEWMVVNNEATYTLIHHYE